MLSSRLIALPAVLLCSMGLLFLIGGSRFTQAMPFPPQSPSSSDSIDLGVVWSPPSAHGPALQQLDRIAKLGTSAVRLTRLPSDTLAARADTLGLELYVDLPVESVPASRLQASLAQHRATLKRLRTLAHRHSSITHVGLADGADTTVPAACEVLRRWTERVHSWASSLRTYYTTPFSASADRCADAVDQPLLALRGHPAPAVQWRRWQSRTETVGIGALGTWTRPDAPPGLRVPHSAERQARYLEAALSQLLDTTRAAPPTVFVDRWQDRSPPLLNARRYGLHDQQGTPRPAARVVHGFYTGQQRTFAFSQGAAPPGGRSGLVLLGWGLLAALGGLYARSLFVRRTGERYFTAPGFYRDALREGRDLAPGTHSLLLVLIGGAIGTTGTRVAQLASAQPITERVLAAVPSTVRFLLVKGLEQPVAAGLALGLSVLGLLVLWMTVLVLAARWGTHFSFAQGLVLIVWPCWPALLILPLALATGPGAPLSPSMFGFLFLVGGVLTCFYVTGRVLYDYGAVTGLPGWTLVPLSLLSPVALAVITVLVLTVRYNLSLPFLWHLATQT